MSPAVMHLWPAGGGAPTGSQEYGVTAVSPGSNVFSSTDFRVGRRFTVGSTDLPLNKLRYYAREAGTYRLILHRDSDSVALATADIVVASGEINTWREETVTAVTLVAGGVYTISSQVVSPATADVYINPVLGSLTYNAAHTHDSYRYSSTPNTSSRPTSSSGATYWAADIGFLT